MRGTSAQRCVALLCSALLAVSIRADDEADWFDDVVPEDARTSCQRIGIPRFV